MLTHRDGLGSILDCTVTLAWSEFVVSDQRLVYSYEMYADDVRFSVSVATIEFVKTDDGTTVTWTEQGAYLDGIDGQDAPRLRQGGTSEMLDSLAKHLA